MRCASAAGRAIILNMQQAVDQCLVAPDASRQLSVAVLAVAGCSISPSTVTAGLGPEDGLAGLAQRGVTPLSAGAIKPADYYGRTAAAAAASALRRALGRAGLRARATAATASPASPERECNPTTTAPRV